MFKIMCILLVLFALTACITTQTPKISHVHVGHAMTAWRNTPDEQGLFVTAEQEAIIAFEQAQYAVDNSNDPQLLKMHIKHVLHAMVPDMVKDGPGLGYGFIKAITAAYDHIIFAADSDDASDNVKMLAQHWSNNIGGITERSELLVTLGKAILKSDSHEEMIVLADEIKLLTERNLYGYDSDGDGIVGNVNGDDGIKQLQNEINNMIDKEDPPYQTVEKKYLFGLIRLPSGKWIFNMGNNTDNNSGAFQY